MSSNTENINGEAPRQRQTPDWVLMSRPRAKEWDHPAEGDFPLNGFEQVGTSPDQTKARKELRRLAVDSPDKEFIAIKVVGPVYSQTVTRARVEGL